MSRTHEGSELLPTSKKILRGQCDIDRLKLSKVKLHRVFNDVVYATNGFTDKTNFLGLEIPIWWPKDHKFFKTTGTCVNNKAVKTVLRHCNHFHQNCPVTFSSDENKENTKKMKAKKRKKIAAQKDINMELPQLKMQAIVHLEDVLKKPNVQKINKSSFMESLNLISNTGKPEKDSTNKTTIKKYSCAIPFSSDLGKLAIDQEKYKMSNENYERKSTKLENYLNGFPVTAETKDYPISFKPTNCDHLYKFPIRQTRQRTNYINNFKVFCKPVSVKLERIDLTKYLKRECIVNLDRSF